MKAKKNRKAAWLVVALLLGFYVPMASASRNILFIIIDDMRHDPQAITPNIDILALESTRYNDAYASVPVCLGSRTTLMTGFKPSTHQVGLDGWDFSNYDAVFNNPFITTLPQELSAAGYTTATMGKVFHSPEPSKWDISQPYTSITTLTEFGDPGPDGTYFFRLVMDPAETHPDQAVADWGSQFIDDYDDTAPFFLAIGFEQPHVPWVLPQWAYDLYPAPVPHVPVPGDLDDEPPEARKGREQYDSVLDAGEAANYTGAYLAAISHTDAMVGQVLTSLANSPHAVNTDIVLLSDHGYHLGEKFRWRKLTFWQPAVRVPLYIKSPAIAAGDVDIPVSLLDIPPTILALAGVAAEPQFEGISLTIGASPVEIYMRNGIATLSAGIKQIDYDIAQPGNSDRARYDLTIDADELNNIQPPGC